MAHLPYAFSIHHFISTVGADAGFASIVGLAILVLLFFAQARETTALRDQLAEASERVQALEVRLSQALRGGAAAPGPAAQSAVANPRAAQSAVANPPAAVSASAAGVASARAGAGAAVAPASLGAPPSAGAPLSHPALAGASHAAAAAASRVATSAGGAPPGVGAPAQGAATRLIPDITAVQPPVTAAATAAGAAATSAGAAGSGTRTPKPAPAPAPVAANGNATSHPVEAPPRNQIRPGGGPKSTGRRPPAGSHLASTGRLAPAPRARRVLLAVLALAAIAGAVVVLLVVTSGGGSNRTVTTTTSPTGAPATHPRHRRTTTTSVAPGSVTVAVLNGTATNGLAHRVAVKLTGGGFRQGNVSTAVDQTRTATTIAYLPGQRKAALAVASALNLGSAAVAPADQTTRTVACQGLSTAACSAQAVIVTVGSDLANIH
ncbi:MAG TPA: LytR C-terminal domain-containing protein [Solirubrobacteraceae bacterium]|nr:LytR C-terminal domain-containing protein [Solirubrobacteraceae bacterium]